MPGGLETGPTTKETTTNDTWTRTTTAIGPAQIPPTTMAAITEYLTEKAGIDGALEAVTGVWHTTSRAPGGFLKKHSEVEQLVLLGPAWLVLVAHDADRAATWTDVTAIRLTDIRVQDYESSGLARLQPDSGLTIVWQAEGPDPSSTFLGLGPGPSAEDLRRRLHEATRPAS